VTAVPVTLGLMAEYRFLPTETCGGLLDYSSNSRNATGTVGTAPTITAQTGGCNFTGNGAITLPAVLNSALTIQLFISHQQVGDANANSAPVAGNGNGTTAGAIQLVLSNATCCGSLVTGGYRFWTYQNNSAHMVYMTVLNGTGVASFLPGAGAASADLVYLNNVDIYTCCGGHLNYAANSGPQTVGTYQLGGAAAGSGNALQTYFTGKIYYAVFYNRALNPSEIANNVGYMQNAMTMRGVSSLLSANDQNDEFIGLGDSLETGTQYPGNLTLNGTWTLDNQAKGGEQASSQSATLQTGYVDPGGVIIDPLFRPNATRNITTIWLGTNDIAAGLTAAQTAANIKAWCLARRKVGWKCLVADMPSRAALDTGKNSLNNLLRTNWKTFADGFIDLASDPNVGADGASANTTYFTDGIHLTTYGSYEITNIHQRAANRVYGNNDFSTATTYVAAAPAATAITASSQSGNTATYTTTLNPPIGSVVTVTGMTPAGYNTVYPGCLVLTTTAGNFTCWLPVSGLGAGSVFGSASIPLQKDADVYSILNFGAGNFSLESCIGYTGQNIYIRNINGAGSTLVPFGSETITGPGTTTVAANTTAILQSQLVSASAGGCNWVRLQ
jgi:hypothetical protein